MTFGQRLRMLRTEMNLTQADLAKRLGLGESTISFYEADKRSPDFEVLIKISKYFGVTTDFLLGKSEFKIDTIWDILESLGFPDGYVPTTDELIKVLNWPDPSGPNIEEMKSILKDSLLKNHKQPIPILGTIRAGVPILAQESYDGYLDVPESIRADFVLRVRDNMIDRARMGIWNGGPIPFGFRSSKSTTMVNGKEKSFTVLIPEETEAEYVKKFFNWYLEPRGAMLSNTKKANNLGIPTKTGNLWNHSQMQRILKNPLYCTADLDAYQYFSTLGIEIASEQSEFDGIHGLIYYNRRKPHKKSTRFKDQSEWVLAVGGHSGIIPGKLYVQAQKKIVNTTFRPARAGTGKRGLLSSLVKCGKCGKAMVYMDQHSRWQYYKCRAKEQLGSCVCSGQTVKGDDLDQAVIKAIKKICTDTAFLEDVARQAVKTTSDNTEPLREDKRRLVAKLDAFAAEQKELVRALGKKTMPVELIEERIQEIEKEKVPVLKQLEEVDAKLESQDYQKIDMDLVFGNLLRFNDAFDELEFEEKRNFLRSIIKEIVYTDGSIKMSLYFLPEITSDEPSSKGNHSDTSDPHGCPLVTEVSETCFSTTIYIEEKHMPEYTFGQRLRKARIKKGLEIREVAARSGVCKDTVSGWETGKHKPRQLKELKKVADVLNISMRYLLGALPPSAPLGKKLIYYRWSQGWNQKEMAEKLGTSPDYLGDCEKGKYIASVHRKAAGLDEKFFGPVLN